MNLLLNLYAHDRKDRVDVVTKEQWRDAMDGFSLRARGDTANLAAHNWDVVLIGDRILVSNAWSGGYWWPKTGNAEKLSDEHYNLLYPVADGVRYPKATRGWDSLNRLTTISREALTELFGPLEN